MNLPGKVTAWEASYIATYQWLVALWCLLWPESVLPTLQWSDIGGQKFVQAGRVCCHGYGMQPYLERQANAFPLQDGWHTLYIAGVLERGCWGPSIRWLVGWLHSGKWLVCKRCLRTLSSSGLPSWKEAGTGFSLKLKCTLVIVD